MNEYSPLITKKPATPWLKFWLPLWLAQLAEEFSPRLLIILCFAQHLSKGMMGTLVSIPAQFVLGDYHVSAPRMQVFTGAIYIPWAMKPMVGLLSDAFPIFGYRKMVYIVLAVIIGTCSCLLVGLTDVTTLPVEGFVAGLFFIQVHLATTDLLTEAAYAEEIKHKPAKGPDLMTFVWGGLQLASLLSIFIAPVAMEITRRLPYLLALLPCLLIVLPTVNNFLGEKKLSAAEQKIARKKLAAQPATCWLCGIMFTGTLSLSALGILYSNVVVNACASFSLMTVILVAFATIFSPVVAKVNAFFLIQTSLSLSIGGASFYFYTDDRRQFPDGPHFSMPFYTGVLGVVGTVCSLMGLYLYQSYLKDWTYRRLLIVANVLLSVLSMLDVIFFLRLNKQIGLPDRMFVLGASCSQSIVAQWMWMPGIVIMSQLVQPGMEATMYALLAGCHNLGNTVKKSSTGGAMLLQILDIHPQGKTNEEKEFTHLWVASLISTMLPLATCVLIPLLIPDAKQNEKLILADDAAGRASDDVIKL